MKRNALLLTYLILSLFTQFVFLSSGTLADNLPINLNHKTQEKPSMKLESPRFTHNGYIPLQYTGEGQDQSPPLSWTNVPEGTHSLALICDDPDAPMGVWDHWIVYNLPPRLNHIEEGGKNLPSDVRLGKNSWGKRAYGGPMPPSGTHHYHFTLYAVDTKLKLKEGATKEELKQAMKGHILAKTTLTGLYKLQHPKSD